MAEYTFPKRGVAFVFDVALIDAASRPNLKSNPTLATGDAKVSKDDGAFANLTTLPTVTPAGGVNVKVSLSATEMTADRLTVTLIDVAGGEWDPLTITIYPATRALEDLAFPANSGRSIQVESDGHVHADLKEWKGSVPANLADTDKVPASVQHKANVGLSTQEKADANAEADQALADAGVTPARTGHLDNLNVGGLVAGQADIQGITQAQRVRVIAPPMIERPDSGSVTYRLWIYAYDEQHKAEDLDSNPTVTAENNAATDRSGNLGAVTKPGGTTGVYYVDYTVAVGHAIEGLVFKVNATEGGVPTQYAASALVVDTTAVDFTSADRAKLDTLHDPRLTAGRAAALDEITAGRMAELDPANLPADVAAVKADTATLLSRITSTLFSGITSLAQWLGLLAGKQTGNGTAVTEIRATGAGGGAYDPTKDSLEAVRDRGDAAWGAGAVPTKEEIADQVWEEVDTDHVAPGTMGARMNAAGGAADPLANPVPGAYAEGTGGRALADIPYIKAKAALLTGGAEITLTSPVTQGGELRIRQGDDYQAADGRSFELSSDDWPDLTGATIEWRFEGLGPVGTASIPEAGDTVQTVRLELTTEESAVVPHGHRSYEVVVTLAGSGHVVMLADGPLRVRKAY